MIATNYWLIPNASSQDYGIQGDNLILWIHVFMILLFVGWGIFYLYCLARFRAKPGQKALYEPIKAKVSKYLEVGVVIFEGFLLLGISVPAWNQFKTSMPEDKQEQDAVQLRVVAHQFQWEFHLPGPDGKFGETKPSLVDPGRNPLGLDENDPTAWDDVWVPGVLKLPKDRPVVAEITSLDVIHSFAVPAMRVKQDAVPGMKVPVWFIPAREGTYDVVCSQLCGNGHYKMGAKLSVVGDEEFEQWQKDNPFLPEEYRPQPTPTPEEGNIVRGNDEETDADEHDSHTDHPEHEGEE